MSLSAAAEKEAIIELKRELVAWGVDSNEAIHRRFREGVIATVRGCFTSINASYHHKPPKIVNPEVLPNNDTAKAIRRVLQSTVGDLDIKFCRDIVDTCGTKRPPYLVYPRKDDPRELTSPKKKFEYKKFSKQQLDPFHRFSVIQYPSKLEYFYDCWVVAGEDARLGGLVFEALVSSHAIHSEPCFHCKCRKSLRWNGGPLTPWTDLVYLHCDSAFEIKSKEGMEAIERGHIWQSSGGSYTGFYDLHREQRKPGWKHYVVMVSRTPSTSSSLSMDAQKWIVQIANIEKIVPRLRASSFLSFLDPKERQISLGSSILTAQSMECWFTIPFQTTEFKPIVFTVLNEHCPKAFAKLMNAKETEQEETDTQVLVSDSVTTTVALDELKANFDADEVKDNWDDSSDEGED